MADEIRILPMSDQDGEFRGRTAEVVQSEYFLDTLPFQRKGRYRYLKRGLDATAGTIVLFQFDKSIIASAVLVERKRFEEPDEEGYCGALCFDVDSIRVFEPVAAQAMHGVWPKFTGFGNPKWDLDGKEFPKFEQLLKHIKTPTRPAQAHDLEVPPAAREQTTVSRIIRDNKLSRRVKSLHEHKCQILTCEYTLLLADGSRYAEGHHIQPLGEPYNGPDVPENILCLCPNHHAAYDLGAIRLRATDLRQVAGHEVSQKFLDYHNQRIYGNGTALQSAGTSMKPPAQ